MTLSARRAMACGALGACVAGFFAACASPTGPGGNGTPSGSASTASSPSGSTTAATSTLVFRASPLDEAAIVTIVPLGNLNPPGHTFPTDHIYINNRRPGEPPGVPVAVYAPGDGQVRFILRSGVEAKIGIAAGPYIYYLAHVVLDPGISEGQTIVAGQRLGVTGSVAYGIDLGVFRSDRHNPFITPARYPAESVGGEAPLGFFDEPLRARLYDRVQRVAGSDRDGQFVFDQAGRLVGNWFLEGLPVSSSAVASAWSQHLAFVYDNYDPSSMRIAIGGTIGVVGVFGVAGGGPDPRDVAPSSGRLVYRLVIAGAPGQFEGVPRGWLLVEMLDATRVRVEYVAEGAVAPAAFSPSARIYVR